MRFFLITCLSLFIFSGCTSESAFEPKELKEDPQLKEEVYSTIINDEELLSDFMSRAMNETEAMQQTMMSEEMMQQMYSQQNMQQNPQMMNNMMQYASEDSAFRSMMRNNENWQPMMDMMQQDGHTMHE